MGKKMLFKGWKIAHQDTLIKGKKNILILNEGLTDGLDDTTIMTEAKYSVNISKSRKKIC